MHDKWRPGFGYSGSSVALPFPHGYLSDDTLDGHLQDKDRHRVLKFLTVFTVLWVSMSTLWSGLSTTAGFSHKCPSPSRTASNTMLRYVSWQCMNSS